MLFIGDVHGKFDLYLKIIENHTKSIQVGDFGAGFAPLPQVSNTHRFIRGNHDDLRVCEQSPSWIPDCTLEHSMFFLGGAYSVDQQFRTVGRDWWPDEELSYQSMQAAIDKYETYRPDVVVSHDAPLEVTKYLFKPQSNWASRTNRGLQIMFDIHKPSLWIHGHWHRNSHIKIFGCEFVSLAELEFQEIDIG
jgi:hypothetical protein